MAGQLDHLVTVSRLSAVRIGVVPLDRQVPNGAHHTFVTYDRRLVTIELFTGQLVLRDPNDIDHYRRLWDFFADLSLWGDESRSLIARVAQEFRIAR